MPTDRENVRLLKRMRSDSQAIESREHDRTQTIARLCTWQEKELGHTLKKGHRNSRRFTRMNRCDLGSQEFPGRMIGGDRALARQPLYYSPPAAGSISDYLCTNWRDRLR